MVRVASMLVFVLSRHVYLVLRNPRFIYDFSLSSHPPGELDLNSIGAIGSTAAAGGSGGLDGGLTVKTAGGAEATNVFGAADGGGGSLGSCSSC